MNHLFICWIPSSSPTLTATVPGIKWVFPFGTQNKCPPWEGPLHSGETAEPLRLAHHLGALISRPQAERSLDRGPFLGEFHNSDYEPKDCSSPDCPCPRISLRRVQGYPHVVVLLPSAIVSLPLTWTTLESFFTVRSQPNSLYPVLPWGVLYWAAWLGDQENSHPGLTAQ